MKIRIQTQQEDGNYATVTEGKVIQTTEGEYDNEYLIENHEGHQLVVQIPTED